MAVMKSKDGKDLIIDCDCGCDEGLRIRVKRDNDSYFFLSYTSGNFYKEQGYTVWRVLRLKLKKIWRIIRGKDYCYSEICMSKTDFQEFQAYISNIE